MLILVAVLAGVLVGYVSGGRLSNLPRLKLRATGLVPAALTIQLLIFPLFSERPVFPYATTALHLGSYALIFLFLLLNRRILPLLVTGLGAAVNLVVISVNGGYMPASPTALERAGMRHAAEALATDGVYGNVRAMGTGTRLNFLGDWLYLPAGVPLATAFSLGDLMIGVGLFALVVLGMRARGD